tara:strand:- start:1489 stop:3273 length:1785 start_codon:yes stop_codon:yes gene_type:complete
MVEQAEVISVQNAATTDTWSAEKTGERWMLREPVLWPANPFAMKSLTAALRSLRWETRFAVDDLSDVGRELENYGLGAGASTLSLRVGEETITLRLGAPTEIGSRLYVLSPDEKEVFVVQRQVLEGLELSSDRLFDTQIIQIPPAEVRSIYIQSGNNGSSRIELLRENESWVLRAPIRVGASNGAVTTALDDLYLTTAKEFADVAPSIHGLDTPSLRLNINGTQRQQTLLVGSPVENASNGATAYAKLEAYPTIFVVDQSSLSPWTQPQESLRERRITPFNPNNASAIQIISDNLSINLQKLESGRWQLITSGDDSTLRTLTADSGIVRDLIIRLSSIEALQFISDAPSEADLDRFGLASPQRTVRIRLESDESYELLLGDLDLTALSPEQSNRLFVSTAANSTVYQTTASILAYTPLGSLHYRERITEALPTGAKVTALRLLEIGSSTPLLETTLLDDGSMQSDGTLSEAESKALLALSKAFRRFPVQRFISEGFTDPLKLDAETELKWRFAIEADIQLSGAASAETRRYVLTERLGGRTQFAGSEALDLVFVLPLELIDPLHPIIFNRPRPDEEDIPQPPATAPVLTPLETP